MTALLIGASAGIGRALAEELAKAGHDLVLTSRDTRDTEAVAQDLRLRFQIGVKVIASDMADFDPVELRSKIEAPSLEIIAYIAGFSMPNQDIVGACDNLTARIATVNFTSFARCINALADRLDKGERQTIIYASSAGAVRPRNRNMVYAASKAAAEFYLRALRHARADRGWKVHIYRFGYLDTRTTFGQKRLLPKLKPEVAARVMVRNLDKHWVFTYLPGTFWLIALVLQSLPWFVFRRLKRI